MRIIVTSKGQEIKVDDNDYEWLNQWLWYINTNHTGYAVRNGTGGLKRITILMHREILEAPKGVLVDHISTDTRDNQRHNLRMCTSEENNQHRKKSNCFPNKYKGVTATRQGTWVARIAADGRPKHLGVFESEESAALAYNLAAIQLHGDFAKVNAL